MSPNAPSTAPKQGPSTNGAIKTVDPSTLRLGRSRAVRGIDSDIDEIRLEGQKFRARVTPAVTDAQLSRTLDGASTVDITVYDPDDELLLSPLLFQRYDLELDGLWFRFVAASRDDPYSLKLSHEDLPIALLRKKKGPKKALRNQMTRAEFVYSLVREIHPNIAFYSPDLHVVQPIAGQNGSGPNSDPKPGKGSDPAAQSQAAQTAKPGPSKAEANPSSQGLAKVGSGITGSVSPVQVGQAMLAAGFPADVAVISKGIAIVNCESGFNGQASTYGFWAELSQFEAQFNCPAPSCTQDLLASTQAAYRAYKSVGWQPWDCAGCEVPNGNNCPSDTYKANFVDDAKKAIRLGGGSISGGGTSGGVTTTTKNVPYAFEVKPNETYWDAIVRLAEEVRWRAFCANGVVYFVSDDTLRDQQTILEISPDTEGVDSIGFDYDLGKPVTQLTVNCRARSWAAPPGTLIEVVDQGPIDGPYLVSQIDTPLIGEDDAHDERTATITAVAPVKALPEPAAQTRTVTSGSPSAPSGATAGGASKGGAALVAWAKTQLGTRSGAKYGCGSAPWCGCFVGYGLQHVLNIQPPSNPAWAPNYASFGQKIGGLGAAQPGDICTWDWQGDGSIDHVNIYMGGGQWIGGNQDSSDVTIEPTKPPGVLVSINRPPGL